MSLQPYRVPAVLLLAGALLLGGCTTEPQIASEDAILDAQATLRQAAESPDPFTRANAIEALAQVEGDQVGNLLVHALSDRQPGVQFAAAMAIGDLRYAPARDTLVRMAEDAGPDKRVYAGVIYALHNLGDDRWTGDLFRLLNHGEPAVRSNAALVMGKMGEPSAIGPLKSVLDGEADRTVQINIQEALAMLGDTANALRLEAYVRGYDISTRLVAIAALAESGSPDSLDILREVAYNDRQPPPARVCATGYLGKMGQRYGLLMDLCYAYAVRSLREPDKVLAAWPQREGAPVEDNEAWMLEQLASVAIGWMGRPGAVSLLHTKLNSESGPVRVAAAMSILRLLAVVPQPGMAEPSPRPEPTAPTTTDQTPEPAKMPEPAKTPEPMTDQTPATTEGPSAMPPPAEPSAVDPNAVAPKTPTDDTTPQPQPDDSPPPPQPEPGKLHTSGAKD